MVGTPRHYFIALAVFFVALSITVYLVREEEWVVHDKIARTSYTCPAPTEESPNPLLRDAVPSLFNSIRHGPSTPEYHNALGQTFSTKDTIWQKPLRKRLLILDIDAQPAKAGRQVLNPSTINFDKFDLAKGGAASRAIMNHYFYALVHGYDYAFFQPAANETGKWMLPHAIHSKIAQHEFVVAMDPDVAVTHMEVPLEWMFNRWGIQEHTSIAMPLDTPTNLKTYDGNLVNVDSQGQRMLNTGFVVAQNSAVTRDMLEKWRDCPTESRYAGCKDWKGKVGHEMGAFSEYVRYDYNFTLDTIVGINCDDAVAWPGSRKGANAGGGGGGRVSDCKGSFVRHFELGSEDEKNSAILGTMNPLAEVLQKQLLKNKNTRLFKERIAKEQDDGKTVPLILEGVVPERS
ncbi:hypothetical protein DE146DRAFT_141193 [Phaeosphaeria sp. MPI-PUGE-AT-0046c]|nr:hypothetical protein DE146DRAFT_141193 [Phaeosphaeria sp. MPI-PUGE-AT-0046c]